MIKDLIELLKQFGVSETIIFSLMLLGIIVGLISAMIKFIKWAILKNNQWLLNENLRPYFSTNDVDRATRYYIPTKYQNVSPSADDEPGKSHIASARELLLPMFLNRAFKNNSDNTKYYLILADAGMGKTTFLINLFLSYTSRPIRNLFGWNENQNIKLFPLGSPDIWADIEKIENKRDTILLLDAFDEDVKAVDDYDARMKEILETTKEFKEIVITCRTQFFPSDKEIPDDTGYTTFGGEQETYKFQRVYLSVFDETDIKKYLKQRFSFFQFSKRKRAFKIVKKSPNLVMRPMLLSYINDFVEANRTFKYSYEIYEVLIDKWIERESKKLGIRKKYGSEEKYRELLLGFSQTLAANLYEKRDERGGYFITKDDFIKDTNGLQITDVDNYGMTETEVRSKSLLNRNAEGKYKFSHKSILEYFLAKELIQNGKFLSTFDFDGMSVTEMFLNEMIEPFRKVKGEFSTLNFFDYSLKDVTSTTRIDPKSPEILKQINFSLEYLTARAISKTVSLRVEELGNFSLQKLSIFTNLERLEIFDKQKYKRLYNLYNIWLFWLERREQLQFTEMRELRKRLERLKFLKRRELRELWKRLKFSELQELRERLERLNLREEFGQLEQLEQLELLLEKNDEELLKLFQPIEDFLKEMKLLQEILPNCKMWY
jgi:hypothetical protein